MTISEQYRYWYDQGLTDKEIAEKTGKSRGAVRDWRYKQKPPLPPNGVVAPPNYRYWYDQGLTDKEISKKADKTYAAVVAWRRRQKPPLPPNGVVAPPNYRYWYDQGLTDKEIAEKVRGPRRNVIAWRRRQKPPLSPNGVEIPDYQYWYDQGLTDKEIAEKTGRSRTAVRDWRKKQKPSLPPNGVTPDYQYWYDQGLTDSEIAKKTGRTRGTISGWRKRQKLPPNSKNSNYKKWYDQGLTDREIATKVNRSISVIIGWRHRQIPPLPVNSPTKRRRHRSLRRYNPQPRRQVIRYKKPIPQPKQELIEFIESQRGGFANSSDLASYFEIKSSQSAIKAAKELLGDDLVPVGEGTVRKYYTPQSLYSSLQRARQELMEFIESRPSGFVKSGDFMSYFELKSSQVAIKAAKTLLVDDLVIIGGGNTTKYYTPQSFQRAKQELVEFIESQHEGFATSRDLMSYYGLKSNKGAINTAKELLGKDFVPFGKFRARKYYTPQSLQRARQELVKFIERQDEGFAIIHDFASYFGKSNKRAIDAAKTLLGDDLVIIGEGNTTKYYTTQSFQSARQKLIEFIESQHEGFATSRDLMSYCGLKSPAAAAKAAKILGDDLVIIGKTRKHKKYYTLQSFQRAETKPRKNPSRLRRYYQARSPKRYPRRYNPQPSRQVIRYKKPQELDIHQQRMQLYLQELTDTEIAMAVGASSNAITVWRRKKGLPRNKPVRRYKYYYEQGYSDKQIADAAGVSRSLVMQWRNSFDPHLPKNVPWARFHTECVKCGTRQSPHKAKGVCQRCYRAKLTLLPSEIYEELYKLGLSDYEIAQEASSLLKRAIKHTNIGSWRRRHKPVRLLPNKYGAHCKLCGELGHQARVCPERAMLARYRQLRRYNPQPSRQIIRYRKSRPMSGVRRRGLCLR
jgi:transposase